MWFLQADTALKLFAAGILWTVLAAVAGRFGVQGKLNRFLVLVDLALIALISPALAGFYTVYTLVTYALTCLAPVAAQWKEAGRRSGPALFVVLCVLCITPFLYLRASSVWTALQTPTGFPSMKMDASLRTYAMLRKICRPFHSCGIRTSRSYQYARCVPVTSFVGTSSRRSFTHL